MSESDISNPTVPWKSKLLESLGVRSAVVVEHGPTGKRCGLALTTALAVAVGAFSSANAMADTESTLHQDAQPVAITEPVGTAENSVFYDAAKLTSTLFVGRLLYDDDEPETVVQRVVGITSSAIRLSSAAPVVGAYMVLDEAYGTYRFVQEREQRLLDDKLSQVSERVARVQREEVMRIRMEERSQRASLPESQRDADEKRMLALVLEAQETGNVAPNLQVRIEVERAIERAGQPTEGWFEALKAQQKSDMVVTNEPSTRSKFMGGMSRMNSALDSQSFAAQSTPETRPPGLR